MGAAGVIIIYFNTSDYLQQQEIKKEGMEVEVVMLKRRHTSKGSVAQIKYKGKTYDWYGGKGEEGRTYSVIYSQEKDEFLKGYSNWTYLVGLWGVVFISTGIYLIVKVIYISE